MNQCSIRNHKKNKLKTHHMNNQIILKSKHENLNNFQDNQYIKSIIFFKIFVISAIFEFFKKVKNQVMKLEYKT
jgi:hypothetical protein